MTDQKPNCNNCPLPKNMRSRYGMNCETLGENIEPDTVEKCGCLIHPGAREWMNQKEIDVISKFGDMEIHQFSATTVLKILRGEWLHD